MTRKDLSRIIELIRTEHMLKERINLLRAQAERTTAVIDGLPLGSEMHSKFEEAVMRIMQSITEAEAAIVELLDLQTALLNYLPALPDPQRAIMAHHYLDGWSFRRIARQLNYSYHYVCKMHRLAVKKICS